MTGVHSAEPCGDHRADGQGVVLMLGLWTSIVIGTCQKQCLGPTLDFLTQKPEVQAQPLEVPPDLQGIVMPLRV